MAKNYPKDYPSLFEGPHDADPASGANHASEELPRNPKEIDWNVEEETTHDLCNGSGCAQCGFTGYIGKARRGKLRNFISEDVPPEIASIRDLHRAVRSQKGENYPSDEEIDRHIEEIRKILEEGTNRSEKEK